MSGVTSAAGVTVFVNASGQLGTATPARAAKDTIHHMDEASARLMSLRPVTFYYREDEDPAGRHQKQQRTIEGLKAGMGELRAQLARAAKVLERLEAR